jgi:hypothetical protein
MAGKLQRVMERWIGSGIISFKRFIERATHMEGFLVWINSVVDLIKFTPLWRWPRGSIVYTNCRGIKWRRDGTYGPGTDA